MSNKTVVLAIFQQEASADTAAEVLKESGVAKRDAIGVLVLDEKGKLKADKVGKRTWGKGAGIGAVVALVTPVGLAAGLIGGGLLGAFHHKNLGLDEEDRERLREELEGGKAAVGVLAPVSEAAVVADKLTELGGTTQAHLVSDEAVEAAQATAAGQLHILGQWHGTGLEPPALPAHVPAAHPGDRHRRERSAERIDEQHARTGLRWDGTLEGLDPVAQTVFGFGRIRDHDHGLVGDVGAWLAPGKDGVGRIGSEAVVALRPPLKKPVGGEMPHDALWPVGEVDRMGSQPQQGHGAAVSADTGCGLHKHVLDGGRRRSRHRKPPPGAAAASIQRLHPSHSSRPSLPKRVCSGSPRRD
jgi:hypothetical protein